MPTIGAEVDAQTKETLKAIAARRSLTPSRLLARLVTEFIAREQGSAAGPPPARVLPVADPDRGTARTEQVFVRLDPYYYAELGRLGAERDWKRGTYLANLLIAHVDRRPVLCQAEIDALRPIARYLADMGRNVNQIARKINSSPQHAHLVMTLEIDLIKALIELQQETVAKLLRANIKGWGVSDGGQ